MRPSTSPSPAPASTLDLAAWPWALAAVCLPTLIAYNVSPSATFFNQAAAYLGWGVFCVWMAWRWLPRDTALGFAGCGPAAFALLLMTASAFAAMFVSGLPGPLALSGIGLTLSAVLVLGLGATFTRSGFAQRAFHVFCAALLLAGVLSLFIAWIQCFAPQWAQGDWIARLSTPGRAGANLRQPNHLSSLLLWAMAALIWLHDAVVEAREQPTPPWGARGFTALLMVALTFGVVLTVSRTGTVCILLLAVWGLCDRGLSAYSRRLLWLVPLIYVLCWFGLTELLSPTASSFAGDAQLHKSDLSSSRFAIWSNTLLLIAQDPWFGVGWGGFNFAWTLTPFPGRPGAFFDHTHNIVLQLLVEMGLPMGLLALGLLAWAVWRAWSACRRAAEPLARVLRCSLVMVLMMAVHSMLEYPLWYAYFLLPTAFAFGLCLGGHGEVKSSSQPAPARIGKPVLVAASVVLALGSVGALADYMRVVPIFSSDEEGLSLDRRIAEGQKSLFFAHHADYAQVTTAEHPSQAMGSFAGATHFLLDTRLMMAWATAYQERGDLDRARHLAQRLREFHNPLSDEFFARCDSALAAGRTAPWQCLPPSRTLGYKDFR
jgi:O-antigen ligase